MRKQILSGFMMFALVAGSLAPAFPNNLTTTEPKGS